MVPVTGQAGLLSPQLPWVHGSLSSPPHILSYTSNPGLPKEENEPEEVPKSKVARRK